LTHKEKKDWYNHGLGRITMVWVYNHVKPPYGVFSDKTNPPIQG